ncbi:DNA primase large subunit Spp2 [Coemansia sp. S85]|nr:DNA primase large subunit Spp2 [Coemansia sp. S85]
MRKTGKGQVGSNANFKGVKRPLPGFSETNSEPTQKTIAIIGAQDSVTLGTGEQKKELVIPVKKNSDWMKRDAPVEEETSERYGLQIMAPSNRPREKPRGVVKEAATEDVDEETYERVPIEEFGAAMLRGMGWKEEKTEGPATHKVRSSLLGLGAKEREKIN